MSYDSRPFAGHRIPVSKPQPPTLSSAASLLLAEAGPALTDRDRFGSAVGEIIKDIDTSPSRPGAEVLAFLATVFSEDSDAAKGLTEMSARITARCEFAEGLAKIQEVAEAGIRSADAQGYARGWAEGQAALKAQLPSVIRETEFRSDPKTGQIFGKREVEYQTTGGSK